MMWTSMYCPSCSGRVVVTVVRVWDGRDVRLGHAAVCLDCSFVSEVSMRGHLMDLEAFVTVEDLDEPPTPTDLWRIVGLAPTPLHGRDS